MLTLQAELWPNPETNSGQDKIVLRIQGTKLSPLFTLEDEGSADEPSPVPRVRRMKLLV